MTARADLTVGTRASQLARWQTDHVIAQLQAAFPGLTCRVETFSTEGDRTLDQPLPAIGGKGLFTAALEKGLRDGRIDMAVHSLKDLPVEDPPGLTVGAILSRADVRDLLFSRDGRCLDDLPHGAVVGTSSLRRQAQLLALRPDLDVRSIRGNVETRLAKVMAGDYDATVLAAAGISRLELDPHGAQLLDTEQMLPAPGQGALAVQCRAGDERVLAYLQALDEQDVRDAVTAERRFLQLLGGGCAVPVAAHAQRRNGQWQLDGLVADPGGAPLLRVTGRGYDPLALGAELAEQIKQSGADLILDRVKPLRSRRVVVTRSAVQAKSFADRLSALGAEPILLPVIAFQPTDPQGLAPFLADLDGYDWLIFTSANAVRFFFKAAEHLPPSLPPIAAIGQGTAAALDQLDLQPDFVPTIFSGEELAGQLGDLSGKRVLLPRAAAGRPETVQALRDQGAQVDDVALYETVTAVAPEEALAEIRRGVDIVTFTSPSSVRNFRLLLQGAGLDPDVLLAEAQTVCIGPSTADQLAEFGFTADLVPANYTIDGMIAAMLEQQ